MPVSRRSLIGGVAALVTCALLPRTAVAARPTLTVYKSPT